MKSERLDQEIMPNISLRRIAISLVIQTRKKN